MNTVGALESIKANTTSEATAAKAVARFFEATLNGLHTEAVTAAGHYTIDGEEINESRMKGEARTYRAIMGRIPDMTGKNPELGPLRLLLMALLTERDAIAPVGNDRRFINRMPIAFSAIAGTYTALALATAKLDEYLCEAENKLDELGIGW